MKGKRENVWRQPFAGAVLELIPIAADIIATSGNSTRFDGDEDLIGGNIFGGDVTGYGDTDA